MMWVVLLTVLVGWACFLWGKDEKPSREVVRAFMRGKLDASKDVLEGLAIEDFGKIETAADRMRLMSRKAEWNSIKTERYAQLSEEFRQTSEKLSKAARDKKLDSAALAWTQITLQCVNCHQYARDIQMTRLERPNVMDEPTAVSLVESRP
jgi:hypothetical protein